jgi:hypothetical protein
MACVQVFSPTLFEKQKIEKAAQTKVKYKV